MRLPYLVNLYHPAGKLASLCPVPGRSDPRQTSLKGLAALHILDMSSAG